MEILLLVLRLFLAGVFLLAGIGKLLDREGSEKAIGEFGVPGPIIKPAASALPLIELAVAAGLIFVATSWYAAIAGAVLLIAFSAGMAWQIKKGNAPDCHCFGSIHSEPVSSKSLVRNLIFLLAALVPVISGKAAQGIDPLAAGADASGGGTMQIILGLAVIGFLAAIVYILKTISDQQNQILRRIEVLELISNEGRDIARDDIPDPNEGLPIGSPVPAFEVAALDGSAVASGDLLPEAAPSLLIFVSPSCHPCDSLLPYFVEWKEELAEELEIIFISRGEAEENREKFGDELAEDMYLQGDQEVSGLLGARWTPTAVLVDAAGRVASHNAVGDGAIRELVENVRNADLSEKYVYFSNGSDTTPSKIGEKIPEFSLKDLDGNEVSAGDLKGRRVLAAFWSTTCPFCIQMVGELRDWDKTKGRDEPELLVFSDGDAAKHVGLDLQSPILLDDGYKTAERLGMNGTPSAVLIDEAGKIVSETAVGADRIWALLGINRESGPRI